MHSNEYIHLKIHQSLYLRALDKRHCVYARARALPTNKWNKFCCYELLWSYVSLSLSNDEMYLEIYCGNNAQWVRAICTLNQSNIVRNECKFVQKFAHKHNLLVLTQSFPFASCKCILIILLDFFPLLSALHISTYAFHHWQVSERWAMNPRRANVIQIRKLPDLLAARTHSVIVQAHLHYDDACGMQFAHNFK